MVLDFKEEEALARESPYLPISLSPPLFLYTSTGVHGEGCPPSIGIIGGLAKSQGAERPKDFEDREPKRVAENGPQWVSHWQATR